MSSRVPRHLQSATSALGKTTNATDLARTTIVDESPPAMALNAGIVPSCPRFKGDPFSKTPIDRSRSAGSGLGGGGGGAGIHPVELPATAPTSVWGCHTPSRCAKHVDAIAVVVAVGENHVHELASGM